jgi:hypothetical protein
MKSLLFLVLRFSGKSVMLEEFMVREKVTDQLYVTPSFKIKKIAKHSE